MYLDGSKEKKYFDSKSKLRYSEHSGLLDFGKSRLQRIIINAKQNISDKVDDTILLPDNMPDAFDFEYMFHTHPSTPNPGSRITKVFCMNFLVYQTFFILLNIIIKARHKDQLL